VRHEDIDDHQVERGAGERIKPGLPAVGDDDRKPSVFEPNANGGTNQRIVVNDENAFHHSLPKPNQSPSAPVNRPHVDLAD
jgi:hypothetical protein